MTERKLKRRFYKQEKARVRKRIFHIRQIVNKVLEEDFGRRLYSLKHDDELRLLTLYAWRDRYKVSIEWILKKLIPLWSKKFARFKINSSLGCRVATLIGKKSEEMLRERIYEEYPHGENKSDWKQKGQEKILRQVDARKSEKISRERKRLNVLEASSTESFIRKYKRELKWKKSEMSHKQIKQLRQVKQKSFRNNPWLA